MNPNMNPQIIPIRIPKKFKSYPNSLNKFMNIPTIPSKIERNLLVKLKINTKPARSIPPAIEDLT